MVTNGEYIAIGKQIAVHSLFYLHETLGPGWLNELGSWYI